MKALRNISFGLLALITIALAAATVFEKIGGSAGAFKYIYHSPWMIVLWALTAISASAYIIARRRNLNPAALLLHLSLILILAGAAVSFFSSVRGIIILYEGIPESSFISDTGRVKTLPFSLSLVSSTTSYHPGTTSPMDYASELLVDDGHSIGQHTVSMNHILSIEGYRFYQTDIGSGVSVLTVSYDPWGIALTYTGYTLLLCAMTAFVCSRHSRFRSLLRKISIVILTLLPVISQAREHTPAQTAILSVSTVREPPAVSGTKSLAENLYNKTSYPWPNAIIILCASLASFIFRRKRKIVLALAALALALLTIHLSLLWIASGHVPMSNGYEAMHTMAWISALIALILYRRIPMLTPLALLAAALSLIVAALSESKPEAAPLVPVLSSPWLSIHVMLMMLSYSLFTIMAINSLISLISPRRQSPLATLSTVLLYPAVFTLAAGIFTGAVWANQTWGRYWGWDPKETWALVTLLIYAIPLHIHSFPSLSKPRVINIYYLLAFLSVLMTYFGVNYLLPGLHSYAR